MKIVSGAAKGYYNPVTASIAIKGMPESQTVKTMIHEIAHSILHNDILDEAAKKDRQTAKLKLRVLLIQYASILE